VSRAPSGVVVERRFVDNRDAQASALSLLVNHTSKDKAARTSGGDYAEERIENAPQRIPSLPVSQ
jgi:hypothetical protein